MKFVICVIVLAFSCGAFAEIQDNEETLLYRDALNFVEQCGAKYLSLCFKERALKYIEKLPSNLDLGGGVKIKQSDGQRNSRQYTPVDLPEEPSAREDVLNTAILERIAEFLNSHTFEFKLPGETVKEMKRSMEEGRKRKGGGGKKGGMNLMMLIQMKAMMLGAIALKVIGLLAFKALLVAKIALTIASVIALKKLLEQKHHSSTYEVVAHPHYEDHGHYDRSFSQDLAYRGQEAARSGRI